MKKLALSFAFAAAVLGANAQSRTEKVGLGVHGGYSLFKMSNVDNSSYRSGFMAGVTATFPVAKNFYIQPELNFQQEGVKTKNAIAYAGQSVKGQLRENYINLPVLAKYKFAPTHLSVFAGPQVGLLAGSNAKIGDNDWVNARNYQKKVDFAGVYGVEYYFPVTKVSSIVVDARYQTSFTNAVKSSISSEKVRNNGFAFTVGYRF